MAIPAVARPARASTARVITAGTRAGFSAAPGMCCTCWRDTGSAAAAVHPGESRRTHEKEMLPLHQDEGSVLVSAGTEEPVQHLPGSAGYPHAGKMGYDEVPGG